MIKWCLDELDSQAIEKGFHSLQFFQIQNHMEIKLKNQFYSQQSKITNSQFMDLLDLCT